MRMRTCACVLETYVRIPPYIYIQVKKTAFKINAKIEDVGFKKVRKQEMVTKFS